MMAVWKGIALCVVLALNAAGGEPCKRREEADWSGFHSAVGSSGLGNEDGVSTLAGNIRAGLRGSPGPQAYAIVGGGEWGPRVVARALLESVLVDWSNDVVVLDMTEEETDNAGKNRRLFWGSESGLQEAQTRLNAQLCDAIMRCPGKAAVVLDNVHLLQGEDIRVLDTMLSLLDGAKSNMDCRDEAVSGEGSLFLLLLNEEGSEETKRLKGKERLLDAWKFKGPEFTPSAFVGRIDAAVSLSEKPRQLTPGMEDAWRIAKAWPRADSGGLASALQELWERAVSVLKDHPKLAAAGAATATMLVAGQWCFRNVHASGTDGDDGGAADEDTGGNRKGGDKGGQKISNGLSATQKATRARGGGLEKASANPSEGAGASGGGSAGSTTGNPVVAGFGPNGDEAHGGDWESAGAGSAGVSPIAAESAGGAESVSVSPIAAESAAESAGAESADVSPVAPVRAASGPKGDEPGEAATGPALSTRSRGRQQAAQAGPTSSRRSSKGRRKSRGSSISTRRSSTSKRSAASKAAGGGGAA